MNLYKRTPAFYWHLWNDVFPILCSVNREHELKRLIAWAKRKRLVKPLHLYKSRLRDEEARIMRYRLCHRNLVPFAYLIHAIIYDLFPPPGYYCKGAASGYSFKKS